MGVVKREGGGACGTGDEGEGEGDGEQVWMVGGECRVCLEHQHWHCLMSLVAVGNALLERHCLVAWEGRLMAPLFQPMKVSSL